MPIYRYQLLHSFIVILVNTIMILINKQSSFWYFLALVGSVFFRYSCFCVVFVGSLLVLSVIFWWFFVLSLYFLVLFVSCMYIFVFVSIFGSVLFSFFVTFWHLFLHFCVYVGLWMQRQHGFDGQCWFGHFEKLESVQNKAFFGESFDLRFSFSFIFCIRL